LDLIYECALFVLGLVFGSFLNVCISRIPRDQSVVAPRSHCPACGAPIRWRDNIPLLGWILLGGRCRDCRAVRHQLGAAFDELIGLRCGAVVDAELMARCEQVGRHRQSHRAESDESYVHG
jgi:hypothetical protein